MESKWAFVLKDSHRVVVDSKKSEDTAQRVGANIKTLAVQSNSNSFLNKLGKRKRTDGCKTILQNYSNFMKSGLPQRLLFHKNAEWNEFPHGIIDMIKEDFRAKKAAIEVVISDCHILLDFMHMIQLDLISGLQTPIAWIDEAGSCFFPELFSVNCETDEGHPAEINLHLEIAVNGPVGCNVEECVEESNVSVKRKRNKEQSFGNNYIIANNINCNKNSGGRLELLTGEPGVAKNASLHLEIAGGTMNADTIRNLFLKAMNPLRKLEILNVSKCSSDMLQNRLELFEKQAEIIQKYRGNSNIQYAWLALSKDTIPSALMYGLGHHAPKLYSKYGAGVRLSSVNCAHSSARYCDSDEKGDCCMVLCRVILGNTELVYPGSQQSRPSSDKYDSGVDDMEHPSQYIVWDVNVNTHIHPEFVVSFRMFPSAEGTSDGVGSRFEMSGVTTQGPGGPVLHASNLVDKGGNNHLHQETRGIDLNAPKSPKSPWMPFTTLLQVISNKVSPEKMKLVYNHYGLFRTKKISKDDFVKQLRLVIGDQLLKSAIVGLRCKEPSNTPSSLKVPKEEKDC